MIVYSQTAVRQRLVASKSTEMASIEARRARAVQLYRDGLTIKAIAERCKLSPSTVSREARLAGLPQRHPHKKPKRKSVV